MTLRADNQFPGGTDRYGYDGGQGATWSDPNLINYRQPRGDQLHADGAGGSRRGRCQLRCAHSRHWPAAGQLRRPGNTWAIANQPPSLWQYFAITVPNDPNLLGWDLRLTNVTAARQCILPPCMCAATPRLRQNNPYYWYPWQSVSWPSGYQWASSADWTGDPYNADLTAAPAILAMGMGNPLQPGNYHVGVFNSSGTTPDELYPGEPGHRAPDIPSPSRLCLLPTAR